MNFIRKQARQVSVLLLIILGFILSPGCTTTRTTQGSDIDKFGTLQPGDRIIVRAISGSFYKGRFVSVNEGILRGEIKKGPIFEIPLSQIDYVLIRDPSTIKTIGLVTGICLTIAVLIAFIMSNPGPCLGGYC